MTAAVTGGACESPGPGGDDGIFDPGTTGLSGGQTVTSQDSTTGLGSATSTTGNALDAALDATSGPPAADASATTGGGTTGLDSDPPDASPLDATVGDADATAPGDSGTPEGNQSDAGGACTLAVSDGTPPANLPLSGNTFAHDPTMVEVDGVFYRFWTGDHIPSARSTDLRSWQNAPTVYGGSYPSWARDWLASVPGQTFNFPWAPDVTQFGGKVHLYSSFSARFGDNVSCITHLTADDIAAGEWTDHGPVLCSEGNEDYNAIDADVALDDEGKPWMSYGSFWGGIFAVPLDENGDRADGDPVHLAWAQQIEAPVLFERCGWHYLFVTHGLCCPGEGRRVSDLTYRVLVGRSRNFLGPYVDREGKGLLDGGGTIVVQGDGTNFAAAGHSDVITVGDEAYHLYHAYRARTGAAELRISELVFDAEGWPVAHAP